ncbi:MAG: ribonuclease HI family protein [Variovorax sp.]|nr:MAG: ribonuclease HI family protein [Variovorax sp.]
MQNPWSVFTDGSALPNPGRMGLGAVLMAPDGAQHTLSQMPPGTGCNNEAELRALSLALQDLKARGATDVLACSDNSVLVDQLGRTGALPIARLAALFEEARMLLTSFERISLVWVPRHRNGEADALARAALGMAPKRDAKRAKGRRSARPQARQQPGGGSVEPGHVA